MKRIKERRCVCGDINWNPGVGSVQVNIIVEMEEEEWARNNNIRFYLVVADDTVRIAKGYKIVEISDLNDAAAIHV